MKNPFSREDKKYEKKTINDEGSEGELYTSKSEENKKIKTLKKYKERDPLYYYYIIYNKEFKYTCKNKNTKNKYLFIVRVLIVKP